MAFIPAVHCAISRRQCIAWMTALGAPGALMAQADFPRQTVRLVLPYPAGGGIDAVGRPLAEQLGQRLGQSVVVDNRGGANGAIGMEAVAKSPPDGHTIVLALDAQFAINPTIYKSLPYDPQKDFAPITLIGTVPYILATNPQSGIKSVADLLELSRKSSQKLNYASSGVGSGAHMAAALLESMAKVSMTHIPNKSTTSSMRDVAENDCQIVFVTYGAAKPLFDAGKLIPIGVTGSKRMALLPSVPTVGETVPGFETGAAYGLFAPAATPPRVIDRLFAEVQQVIQSAAYQQRISSVGVEVVGLAPAAFAAHITKDLAKWKSIVSEKGISAN